jgi:predicted phage terminase large subunit-like protein
MSKLYIPNSRIVEAACRRDFPSFLRKCFHTLSPSAAFQMNWHVLALAYYLELVRRGEITRLIINLPPRYLKSIAASIAFPAFVLGHDPAKRIIGVSYGLDLALKLSNDFRRIVSALWYRQLFPLMEIVKNTEAEIVTQQHGFRLATSIDGALTGIGGDILIIDDYLKPADAFSDSKRAAANDWFFETAQSRLDNKQEGAIIIIGQRLNPDDLSGKLMRWSDEWTVLSLPAIAVQEEQIPIGDNQYHLRRVGDLLHAEREPLHVLESLRSQRPDVFAAQYQQNPMPRGGAIIKPEWLPRYDELPKKTSSSACIQIWDTASKLGEENSRSACVTLLIQGKEYYVVHVWVGQCDYVTLKERAISLAQEYKPAKILIEDAEVGTALIGDLKQTGLETVSVKPEGDKVARLLAQLTKIANGKVFLPKRAAWLADLESELFVFPYGDHDDVVDALVHGRAYQHTPNLWTQEALNNLDKLTWNLAWSRIIR